MASDLTENLLKVDRKLLSTLLALLIPGELTLEYLRGRRARYLRPFTVYFILAGLVFWAFMRAPLDEHALQTRIESGMKELLIPQVAGDAPDPELGIEGAWTDLKAQLYARVKPHISAQPERLHLLLEVVVDPKWGRLPATILYLLGLVATTRRRRLLLSEQVVYALHVGAFGSLVSLLDPSLDPSPWLVLPRLIYEAVAFFRVYRFGLWGSAWRFAILQAWKSESSRHFENALVILMLLR